MASRYAPSASDIRYLAAGAGAALAVWLVPFSALPWVIGAGVVVYAVLSMHFLRESTRVLILWTLICAIPVVVLVSNFIKPVPPGCWDMCGAAAYMASIFILIIFFVWLLVAGVILWLRNRQPRRST